MADGVVGGLGAVYGHPGRRSARASPARVGDEILAVGTDIYRTGTSRRHVYVLAADARARRLRRRAREPDGEIIGMAFAIDPGRNATAYALTDAEIEPVLASAERSRTVETGRCLSADRPHVVVASARRLRHVDVRLLSFDEDALAGALLGGFDDRVEHVVGESGQTLGAARVGEDLRRLPSRRRGRRRAG